MQQSFIRAPYIGSKNAILISIDPNVAGVMDIKKKILEAKKQKKKVFYKFTIEEIHDAE